MQGLVAFLKGLGAARLAAMIAVTAALIGFFAFVIMRVTTPQLTTLFTDLFTEDSWHHQGIGAAGDPLRAAQ